MPNVLTPTDLAQLSALVADIAFDTTLPLYHRSVTPDSSGNAIETYATTPDLLLPALVVSAVKLFTSEQLALYADVIASKQLLLMHFAPGADVREDDRVTYEGKEWRVVPIAADSFHVTGRALLVTTREGA